MLFFTIYFYSLLILKLWTKKLAALLLLLHLRWEAHVEFICQFLSIMGLNDFSEWDGCYSITTAHQHMFRLIWGNLLCLLAHPWLALEMAIYITWSWLKDYVRFHEFITNTLEKINSHSVPLFLSPQMDICEKNTEWK